MIEVRRGSARRERHQPSHVRLTTTQKVLRYGYHKPTPCPTDQKPPKLTNAERQARFRAKRDAAVKAADPGASAVGQLKRQHCAAAAVAAVAVVLTALSLHHLASGIALVTLAPTWEAWAMAIGIDLGFLALELAGLCAATDRVRAEVGTYARPAIAGTLAVSGVLNALAFGAQAQGLFLYPAVALGVAIPALIYCLSRVAFSLAAHR